MNDKQEQLIQNLTKYDNWDDRYAEIINIGKNMPEMPIEYKTDDNKVAGCQSQVWIHAMPKDGKIYFVGDSDALIVKGILAMVLSAYNGLSPAEILNTKPYFIEKIGLAEHLSITRKNGLGSMLKQIQYYALGFQAILG